MLAEILNRFRGRKKEPKTAPSIDIWNEEETLRIVAGLNILGKNNPEVPSPNNLRRQRENNQRMAAEGVAHRKRMFTLIEESVRNEGLPPEEAERRQKLWDVVNGYDLRPAPNGEEELRQDM